MRITTSLVLLGMICTMTSAASPKPDIVVAADGSGQFKTVQEAVQSVPADNRDRMIIFIKDGVYHEKVRIDAACITLRGQSRAGTRIEFPQLNDDFTKNPDQIGRAVVNIQSDDVVLENLSVINTAGQVGPHAFAVYGRGTRTVIVDSDVLSDGADTVSLWKGDTGMYYHARCNFKGSVDFVCPRGWCYITDCTFYEMKDTAAMWHDGSKDRDQKFVLRNCKFDGVDDWKIMRHHIDAQIYFLECYFSKTMSDNAPYKVMYPIDGAAPTTAHAELNAKNALSYKYGERSYFYECTRDGGNYPWMKNNLDTALGSPKPEQITPAWTFAGRWDPEAKAGPKVKSIKPDGDAFDVTFDGRVTVKGKPVLQLADGQNAAYTGGSGTETLHFANSASGSHSPPKEIDLNGAAIVAAQANAALLDAVLKLPAND